MEYLEYIGKATAVLIAALGIAGGLLSLPERIRKYRRDRRPHGDKGAGFMVLSKNVTPSQIEVRFLIVEDLVQVLAGLVKVEGVQVGEIHVVGEYFDVILIYPPGTPLDFRIVRK